MRSRIPLFALLICTTLCADPTPPVGHFPHIEVDVKNKQIRVECEALHCEAPLEFFCVTAGGNEHESVIRTRAKPSEIHTALLMLGLQPGEPVKYSESAHKWFPPHGPPLNISIEYAKDGKQFAMPAYKLMRDVHTKKSMPPMSWVFTGSRIMQDGTYAADVTSYVVSIVNFDLTLIDIPALASSANETLEWETDLDVMPPLGSPMTMIIEPADNHPDPPAPPTRLSDVTIDQQKVDRLRQRWESDVKPHATALRDAAQAEYEVITDLRREQQRLIDESDRIQRLIDELEQQYQQMTTPRPEPTTQP
jgi:hypothetical protein